MRFIEPKDNRTCFARKSYLTMLTEPVEWCQNHDTLTLVKLNTTHLQMKKYVIWGKLSSEKCVNIMVSLKCRIINFDVIIHILLMSNILKLLFLQ